MVFPLVVTVWLGVFCTLILFQIYRPATVQKPRARWFGALQLPDEALTGSSSQLLVVSIAGLFLELLMIRWISSEITIFAYFKNFVLIACFLGFGLGAHLSRQPVNLLAMFGPLIYFALLIKLPWQALRDTIQKLTSLLGATTEVDVWGVPTLQLNQETIAGLAVMLVVVIPMFAMLSLIFIPVGQATARMMEGARDGILGYSINIIGSLAGVLLYTALCLFYQPPATWFAVAGVLVVAGFYKAARVQVAALAVFGLCIGMTLMPDSNKSVTDMMDNNRVQTTGGHTEWSPYQKLHWAETREHGELVAYQLMTNDSWYQYVVNLSAEFVRTHADLFDGVPPEWNAYNIPYQFFPSPPAVLVLGSGMGNDVAAALRNGAGKVTAVEIDPMIIDFGRRLHFERPYADSRVTVVNDDARSYMQNSKDRFNLIAFSLLDSHTTASHYANIRIDNYVYTREALKAARRLLKPDGIMVVKFNVGKAFIGGRLKATLTEVFGAPPVEFGVDQSFNISPGTFFVAGSTSRIEQGMERPELRRHVETHARIPMDAARVTTDDWPFFYQHAPGLPSSVILVSFALVIVCWQLMKRTAVPLSQIGWPFFFLGAGFMLMESQIVSRMALLFGTTWIVNSITISGLLALIVAANLMERAGLRIPTPGVYAGLLVTLLTAYFVPVSALLAESKLERVGAAVAVLCSPVFFASLLFIRAFAAAHFSGAALGSNLLGSLAGGLLESLSMWTGLRSMLILALIFYLLAYVSTRHRRLPGGAKVEAEPAYI